MPTTPNRNYPFPALSSANDPPRDLQLLAEALDADVAQLVNPAPVAPVYNAGWGEYTSATSQSLLVTRASGGLVGLSGLFARRGATIAATAAVQQIGTLPEGYRPSKQIITVSKGYCGNSGVGINGWVDCRVDITTAGVIEASWLLAAPWTQNTGWVTLAGLSYVAAP